MQFLKSLIVGVALLAPLQGVFAQTVDLEPYVREDSIREVKISPTGEFYAASVPIEGQNQTGLVIFRRDDMKPTATLRFRRDTHVAGFWWVSPTRVIMEIADTYGERDYPSPTGELYAIDADGKRSGLLVGWRVQEQKTGTRIRTGPMEEDVAAFVIDTLPDDDDNVLIAVWPFSRDPFARVEKMNVYSGRRSPVAKVSVPRAGFVTDNKGQVRFARGATSNNYSQLFYRGNDGEEWRQINHERDSGRVEAPLGFSPDDRTAYLRVTQERGPDAIVAMDIASGERREVARDALLDPQPIYLGDCGDCSNGWDGLGWGRGTPIGAHFSGAGERMVFFDATQAEAQLLTRLSTSFPGSRVRISSSTRDGRYKVVQVESDVDPGSFYLYDAEKKSVSFMLARGERIDPQKMSAMRPISLKARDGIELHGFLTVPAGSSGKNMPLVVLPHGGPFGVWDTRAFGVDAQLLAEAGYAVLQVNFRGSGNYGRRFKQAGAGQWGGTMQDDLTDATRWVVGQGIADGKRVCIYGASYGAYAALMGAAREPALYRCAVGYVGVYDLPRMQNEDRKAGRSMRTWSEEWVGTDGAKLAATSPNRIAAQVKVPVFLAAGGEDMIAPIEHSRLMERALKAANVPVETLYYPDEGHGFYKVEHRREFYSRLLAFLGRHLGDE